MEGSTAGKLLIATPTMLDPNFHRTVLFMVEHTEDGALGLVLNRPTASAVADHVGHWATVAAAPPLIFVGGPVANEVAVGLAQDPGSPPEDWHEALPGVGLIDLTTPPSDYGGVGRARVFSGYAGWDASQLDFELSSGSWVVLSADTNTVFSPEPENLWREVLGRDSGLLRMYAHYPDDPRLN
jgi:putative transcriptional regulator